jgi:NAD(P)-dependent dehydrogenase (short-subunit alcohol dehydrogenase family)
MTTAAAAFDLAGRVALVTGAGSGLGRSFAGVLGDAGAVVVLCGRRRAPLEETAAQLASRGVRTAVHDLDVCDEAALELALAQVAGTLGEVDILVNNAGTNHPQAALKMSLDDWDNIVDTNLRGSFVVARAVAKRLIAAGRPGSIVNIASVLGLRTQKGVAAYAASKAGVLHLTRVLALEWMRYGIRVNALVPGYFRTGITDDFLDSEEGKALVHRIPARRTGDPAELGPPLLLLASSASSYMTGSALAVDGGLMAASL